MRVHIIDVRPQVREGEDVVCDRVGTVTNDVAFTDRRSPKPVSSPAPATGSPITLLGHPQRRCVCACVCVCVCVCVCACMCVCVCVCLSV